jgi:stage II sporulation protein D
MPIRGSETPLRRLLVLTAVLSALAVCSSASAAPVFYIWGKGWGHGIGMPQYGAYGYALHGKDYRWILAHFYQGTEPASASKTTIRVLLDARRTSVTIASPSRWTVEDGRGRSFELAGGSRTVGTALQVRAEGKRRQLTAPLTFRRANGGPLTIDGDVYRGKAVVRKPGGLLAIVNVLGLQPYLFGVVPGEMPADWHLEALKAQAVAARSYGLANRTTNSYFDVYDDTRDQVYGGVAWEKPRSNEAVRTTANEVRTYNGGLATTYFYSSSGGRTANNEDVWTTGSPVPYLRSVRDRWDTISPYHRWGPIRYSRAGLDARLGGNVAGALRDVLVNVTPSLRAGSIKINGSGGPTSMPGWEVRETLGLRSSWFRVGVVNIAAGRQSIERGEHVRLRGKARAVGVAWLERRASGGEWTKVRDLALNDEARFSTVVSPRRTSDYRVASLKGASYAVRVQVTAAVRFSKPSDRSGLSGLVSPAGAAAKVKVQRRAGGAWKTVGVGSTDSSGRFSIAFDLVDGAYRAIAIASGVRAGVSPTLRIVG